MHNRRKFFQLAAAGSAGMLLMSNYGCQPKAASTAAAAPVDRKSFGVGLQLYTVRDAMTADVPGTLKKLSDLGYKNLELAGYSNGKFYGVAPAEFKKMVSDLGMEVVSSHTQVEAAGITLDTAKTMADDHAFLGAKYCVQPWIEEKDRNIETYKKFIADWNKIGEVMKERGLQFGYHNHNFEFKPTNGIVPYFDIFLPEMDANLITMELDLFWANKAGQDPIAMFQKYPGRFQLLHFKDMGHKEAPFYDVIKDDITTVGSGVIDFKQILANKDTAGMKYLFVEDDNQGNGKTFESLEVSINNLCTKILV